MIWAYKSIAFTLHLHSIYITFVLRLRYIYFTFTLHLHYIHIAFTLCLHLHYICVIFTLQLHMHSRYSYITFTSHLRCVIVTFHLRYICIILTLGAYIYITAQPPRTSCLRSCDINSSASLPLFSSSSSKLFCSIIVWMVRSWVTLMSLFCSGAM